MSRVLPHALLSALFILAACGGGSGPPTPTIDFDAAARVAATDALVTLDDLPQFWIEGTEEDQIANVELSSECDVFDPQIGFPGAVATDQSPVYLGTGERQATFVTPPSAKKPMQSPHSKLRTPSSTAATTSSWPPSSRPPATRPRSKASNSAPSRTSTSRWRR